MHVSQQIFRMQSEEFSYLGMNGAALAKPHCIDGTFWNSAAFQTVSIYFAKATRRTTQINTTSHTPATCGWMGIRSQLQS
jgi:hypothetical protein